MKIAITSSGNNINAASDARFGRCPWFLIYDTETKEQQFFENPAADAQDGAGPVAVQFVASKGVKKIISGEFGVKIRPLLDELGIEMVINEKPGRVLSDIINEL